MRPQVSGPRACHLAMRHWGLDGPLACVELAGYDDRNLRLTGVKDGRNSPWQAPHFKSMPLPPPPPPLSRAMPSCAA